MKKIILFLSILISVYTLKAITHTVFVWNGYFKFVETVNFSADITIQLGDTVQWLPMDEPTMVHTITSTTIPSGAIAFDQVWQAPADTFFQYIPQIAGLYEYECTPHAISHGMVGSITVLNSTTINDTDPNTGDYQVYPNPATNFIYFYNPETISAFKIFGLNGNLILQDKAEKKIDISTLENGIYILEIIGDKPKVMRIIKR